MIPYHKDSEYNPWWLERVQQTVLYKQGPDEQVYELETDSQSLYFLHLLVLRQKYHNLTINTTDIPINP